MKIAYVAGKYRSLRECDVYDNIQAAREVALQLWEAGFAVVCPHMNTAFFGGAAPDEVWLAGDIEIMKRCDCVVCVSNWRISAGALGEINIAKSIGHPVFETVDDAVKWLREQSE